MWKMQSTRQGTYVVDGEQTIAQVYCPMRSDKYKTLEAAETAQADHGKVIAAAPDLLRVCEEIVKYMDANGGGIGLQIGMAAKIAITKAKGQGS